jgi:hypothetical protein
MTVLCSPTGIRVKPRAMRPISTLLIALLLALSTIACGEEEAPAGGEAVPERAQEQLGERLDAVAEQLVEDTAALRRDIADAVRGEADPEQLRRLGERADELQQRAQEELPGDAGDRLSRALGELGGATRDLREAAESNDAQALEDARQRFDGLREGFADAADDLTRRLPEAKSTLDRLREDVPELAAR